MALGKQGAPFCSLLGTRLSQDHSALYLCWEGGARETRRTRNSRVPMSGGFSTGCDVFLTFRSAETPREARINFH